MGRRDHGHIMSLRRSNISAVAKYGTFDAVGCEHPPYQFGIPSEGISSEYLVKAGNYPSIRV